jgi:hypothetical protein
MADSTTNVDTIASSQAQKEVTANAFFDAVSIASAFGRRASTSTGLTLGLYGVARWKIDGVAVTRANAAFALTGSSTRYVSINRTFTSFSEDASVFDPAELALYKCVTSGSAITSYEDHRDLHHYNRFQYSRLAIAMADAHVTLTYEQAMCDSLEFTGANTAVRNVVVPAVPRAWTIYANTTTNGVLVCTAGSPTEGVTIAVGKTAIVECDGTRVRRITADNP